MPHLDSPAHLRRLVWPAGLLVVLLVVPAVADLVAEDHAKPTAPIGAAADPATSSRRNLPVAPPASPRRPDNEKLGERLREGTRLTDVLGAFQSAGDRISFHPDGGKGESYRVLENLALERIDGYLGSARGTPTWTVSGLVTEFRGSNYLLVSKAVVRSVGDGSTGP